MNPEQLNINNEKERKIEINLDQAISDFVNVDEKDVFNINEEIDNILGVESQSGENTKYYAFSEKEEYENFARNNTPSSTFIGDNAFFISILVIKRGWF
jgi:hypothetical protein